MMSSSVPNEAIVQTREVVRPLCESQTAISIDNEGKDTVDSLQAREAVGPACEPHTAKSIDWERQDSVYSDQKCPLFEQKAKLSNDDEDSDTVEVLNLEDLPQRGAECQGDNCKRVYDINKKRKWSFKKVKNPALSDTSYMKSPVWSSSKNSFKCELCGENQDSEDRSHYNCKGDFSYKKDQEHGDGSRENCRVDIFSQKDNCCSKPILCICKKRSWWCGTSGIMHYWPGKRKHNPIWTGDDPNQLGIFIRNLKVLGIHEGLKTISVQFYLNIVWLDKGFCKWIKQETEIYKEMGEMWYLQLRTTEYEERYEQYLHTGQARMSWQEALRGSSLRKPEWQYNTLPNVVIWNSTNDGYKEIENLISLNKPHIGKDTVYWRRLIRATLHVDFHSRSYPWGYERFLLEIRLLSWTNQHFALLRTKSWYDRHLKFLDGNTMCNKAKGNMDEIEFEEEKARNKLLADHTFSYIHPDNSRIPDWKICSVHGGQDQWISFYDNNELQIRLPVRVTRGLDTQSSFEAMIIVKHRPSFVLKDSWWWFSLSTILALLTYQLHPNEWEGRLGIAVAVIFVQMNLRNHTGWRYPRVVHTTALDVHISFSILFVVLQAFIQCVIRYAYNLRQNENDDETNSENILQIDLTVGWVNFGLVLLMNLATYGHARCQQRFERLIAESRTRFYTGFNVEPLAEHGEDDIAETVNLKGMDCSRRMKFYGKVRNQIIDGRERTLSTIQKSPSLQTSRTMIYLLK